MEIQIIVSARNGSRFSVISVGSGRESLLRNNPEILRSSIRCYTATITHPARTTPYTAVINTAILPSLAEIHICIIINYSRRVVTFFK